MIQNLEGICDAYEICLILVSNNIYEFATENICAADLPEKFRSKLIEKIQSEYPDSGSSVLSKIHFHISHVPVDEIETFLKGETSNLFETRFGDDYTQNINSWIRLIKGEIKRKNNFMSDQVTNEQELREKKCIGRSFIEQSLDNIEKLHKNAPDMSLIKQELSNSGWSFPELVRLDKAFPQAIKDYQDPSNTECKKLCDSIQSVLDGLDLEALPLSEVIENISSFLEKNSLVPPPYNKAETISVFIIKLYHEKI